MGKLCLLNFCLPCRWQRKLTKDKQWVIKALINLTADAFYFKLCSNFHYFPIQLASSSYKSIYILYILAYIFHTICKQWKNTLSLTSTAQSENWKATVPAALDFEGSFICSQVLPSAGYAPSSEHFPLKGTSETSVHSKKPSLLCFAITFFGNPLLTTCFYPECLPSSLFWKATIK